MGSDRCGHLLCESQVGLKEGLDGSNVLPVVVEEVGHHLSDKHSAWTLYAGVPSRIIHSYPSFFWPSPVTACGGAT